MIGAPTLVLMYHRVAALPRDTHELCVAPDRFAAHVEHLRRHERAVPLVDVMARRARRRVVVTFDDGYADNANVAADILEVAGVPATFFVTTDLVGSTTDQWFDELELVVFEGAPRARHLEVDIAGAPLVIDLAGEGARARAHRAIYRRLRPLRRPQIDDVIRQLRDQLDAPPPTRASHRFMTADELRRVARSDVVDVGGHAATHQQLSSLDEREQHDEIVGGRRRLQALTGTDVATFAYPFGGPETIDDTSLRLVEEAGYDLACIGQGGVARRPIERFRVPRVVVKDWSAEELAARIDGWFSAR